MSVCPIPLVSGTRVLCVVCEVVLTSGRASRGLPEERTVAPHPLGLVSTRATRRDAYGLLSRGSLGTGCPCAVPSTPESVHVPPTLLLLGTRALALARELPSGHRAAPARPASCGPRTDAADGGGHGVCCWGAFHTWAPVSLTGRSPGSQLGPQAKGLPGVGGGGSGYPGLSGGAGDRLSPAGAPKIGGAPFSLVDYP